MKGLSILFVFSLILLLMPSFCLAEQININTATLSQLDELTGIGPTYAQRIIDNRPYSSLDDLLKVKGIGPATLEKIKTQGLACVNCQTIITSPTSSPAPALTATPSPSAFAYPETTADKRNDEVAGVFLNEILPNPEGADETNEWVELHNINNFDVNLSNWKIKDVEGTVTTYTFPENTKIEANGYLVLKRPETKIMLQNDGDGLNLFWPNGKLADSILYKNAPSNRSYNRIEPEWKWSNSLTPAARNVITLADAEIKNSALPTPEKSAINKTNSEPAALTGSTKTSEINPWFLFITILVVAIISAIAILFLKLKFAKKII